MSRRTKYRKDYNSQIIKTMAEGCSIAQAAKELGVTAETIELWERDPSLPEFKEVMKYARDYYLAFWEEMGKKIASGEIKGNAAVWIYNMKCRFGDSWNDDAKIMGELLAGNEKSIDDQLKSLMKEYFKDDGQKRNKQDSRDSTAGKESGIVTAIRDSTSNKAV